MHGRDWCLARRAMRPLMSLVVLAVLACGCGARSAAVSPELDAGTSAVDAGAQPSFCEQNEQAAMPPQCVPPADAAAIDAASGGRATVDDDVTVQVDPTVCHAGYLCSSDAACHGTVIRASDYDQSCTTASDCVAVQEGDTCTDECGICFAHAAINQGALEHYRADLRATIAAGKSVQWFQCPCPSRTPQPCCQAGRCAAGIGCEPLVACDPGTPCTTDSDCACLDVGRCNDAGHCAEIPVPKCVRGRCE
jgi:hypothetical protein